MASYTVVCCNAIVPELLNQHNYEHWSSRVETYLLAKDLWDVVTAEPPRPAEAEHKAWTKKNAKALHAIKNSCGADMFSFISKVRTAKKAWEVLEEKLKSRPMLESSEEREKGETDETDETYTTINTGQARDEADKHNYNHYVSFFGYVSDGDWDNANKCRLKLEQLDFKHALRVQNEDGYTALHVAVHKRHVHIVKELVQLMTEKDLEIKDKMGCTPLAVLIHDCMVEKPVIEMARYMVKKNNKLLSIPFPIPDGEVPIKITNRARGTFSSSRHKQRQNQDSKLK